ncbi:Spermidine/putrescine import ATP-binding protein PotA [bacterium HR39]|nr:Spermidine/putrescine import ATP-binding protein PotA [bacterium HR39]
MREETADIAVYGERAPGADARAEPPGLEVRGLAHGFGPRRVVDGVSFTLRRGEVHCLVGPSGCGKTTTLRLIAGLETVQEGEIRIGGRLVAAPGFSVPPERRRVGLMFQDFALFPHLTVAENVAFGLRHLPRRERERRVRELLERVDLAGYANRYPDMLSGGEQQRVALARALAPKPQVMLLDEAFSALDTSLRARVREETLAVLREAGTPVVLVTHDPEEAIRAGDVIHAMLEGRIVQSGRPAELYARPLHPFVAGFFGPVNEFRTRVRDGRAPTPLGDVPAPGFPEGEKVLAVIRPEGVRLRPPNGSGLRARIDARKDLGPVHLVWLGLPDGTQVRVRESAPVEFPVGSEVAVEIDPAHAFVFPAR